MNSKSCDHETWSTVRYGRGKILLKKIGVDWSTDFQTHPILMYRKKNLYGLFLWMGFNCLKAIESLQGGSLLFTTKLPEVPGTHLIDVGRMKG